MRNFSRGNGSGSRDDRFGGRNDREERQMHRATCADCGKNCEVPFRPTGDKPVFCSSCFQKNDSPRGRDDRFGGRGDRSGGRDRGFKSRDERPRRRDDRFGGREERQMYKAVCDACHQSCEVPFRPSGDKPVFCNDCFGKDEVVATPKVDVSSKKHDEINAKLDKIIALLHRIDPSLEPKKIYVKKEEVEKALEKKAEVKKVVSPKKVAVKKVASKKVEPKKAEPKKATASKKATPKKKAKK